MQRDVTYPKMVDVVPPGTVGEWRVEHFTVSEQEARFANMRASWHAGGGIDMVDPGRYAKLVHGASTVVMSDTRMERRTNAEVLWKAHGDVLLGGLGLGMVVCGLAQRREVNSIVVLEREQAVIDLVWPHLLTWFRHRRHCQLAVIRADAFEWAAEVRARKESWTFDAIYFDIWTNRTLDNLPEIAKLHQRYKGMKRPGGWMSSWCADLLRAQRDEERRANIW